MAGRAILRIPQRVLSESEFDSYDLGEILQSLPDSTKVEDCHYMPEYGALGFRVFCPDFKENIEGTILPFIEVKKDEFEDYSIDEDTLPYSKKFLNSRDADPFDLKTSEALHQIYIDEHKTMSRNIETAIWDAAIKGKGEITIIGTPSVCNHSWKSYKGILEEYEYCEHCDEKK